MRPSKLKTPLAKLRAMLKVQTGEMTKKRTGKVVKTYAPLSRQDVAGWLGCGVDNISSIESDRVKLTRENAEIIMQQSNVSLDWLLGKDSRREPIHISGRPYNQSDFDKAQAALKHPGLPALKAQREFTATSGFVATILLRACQRGEIDTYASKLRNALRDIFSSFPKNQPYLDLGEFLDLSETSYQAHDLRPMLNEWNNQLLKVVDANMKRAARNSL